MRRLLGTLDLFGIDLFENPISASFVPEFKNRLVALEPRLKTRPFGAN